MTHLIDIGDVARMLNDRMDQLAPLLLPLGARDGPEWRAGSVAGERGKSLGVRIAGARKGVWRDFSNPVHSGDGLDLVAWCLFSGDKKQALVWAKGWLGLDTSGPDVLARRRIEIKAATKKAEESALREVEEKARLAKKIWIEARPDILDTPVDYYLAARGIDLRSLPAPPRALRYSPSCRYPDGRFFPAMVACIMSSDGKMLACHRTFLEKRGGTWKKANVEKAKMVLGPYRGGFIPLNRGASLKPIASAPDGEEVIIAEGIETALSVAVACPDYRVLAAVSVSNFSAITLPPTIGHVTLALDNDGDNPQTGRAIETAIRRFQQDGYTVRTMIPDSECDFNDILQSGGATCS